MEQAVTLLRESLQAGTEINTSLAESTIRFRTALDEAALSQVLAKLVQAGVLVTQFRELQTDLEDAFMTVTRRGDSQQAASEAVPVVSNEEEASS
jgi:ABC-2 type transport system ATP-binding protein